VLDASQSEGDTTIFYQRSLRELWSTPREEEPSPLAKQWQQQYPGLFDDDDLRLTIAKGHWNYHFNEWFTAIHLFERHGAISMVEKYDQRSHVRKFGRYERFTTEEQRLELARICKEKIDGKGVQLPDLFVMSRDDAAFWFVETKRPHEPVSLQQAVSHKKIRAMDLRVDVITVEPIDIKPH
jgi:hypothetical protein